MPSPDGDIDAVIRYAAESEAPSIAGDPSAEDFRTLADSVDLLIGDIGRWEAYKAASVEYIEEFTKEIRWHRRVRLAVVCACGLLVLLLVSFLIIVVMSPPKVFVGDTGHSLTALIVATVSGAVVITITVARGAFATMADRNAGLPMPEQFKELIEAGKGMLGGGHH